MTSKSLFAILPTLILACALPSSGQHFQQIQGATLTQIAAGGASVWGLDSSNNVFRYNPNTQTFDEISGTALSRISAGGGNISQPDEVWGINGSGQVFRFNTSSQTFDSTAGTLSQIVVGVGYSQCNPYEVWGLRPAYPNTKVFRYNFCTATFDQINVVGTSFIQIATGGGEVWAVDGVFAYRFDVFDGKFDFAEGPAYQIAVGANALFGNDSTGQFEEFDVKQGGWFSYGGKVRGIAAGGDGVWVLDKSNVIYRLLPTYKSFIKVSGTLARMSVGSGTGVWGINTAGQVFVFETP